MLRVISPLKGFAIEASDGRVGTVVDFLFDDTTWKVRWLVIDCGTWLTGRKVLIHPSAISREDFERQQFVVALTKPQVEESPELLEHQPVSQQMEESLYSYYGWDPLWGGPVLPAIPGAMASPLMAPHYMGLGSTDLAEARAVGSTSREADPHLRSVVEVTGYRVLAVDGEIGHIENLVLDDADWSIRYFIVDTRNWWSGKRVLISPIAVKTIDWFDRHVELNLSRELVKASRPGTRSWLSPTNTQSGSTSTMAGPDRRPSAAVEASPNPGKLANGVSLASHPSPGDRRPGSQLHKQSAHPQRKAKMSQDRELQEAVMVELGWEPSIDAAHIGVAASAGVVTLSGHVKSFPQKVAAEQAAARVKGVKALAEEIVVELPHDVRRSDESIARAAVGRLAWDASVPANAVEIKVEKGWVTLSGEVDWQFQKEAAAQSVRTLIGVVGVSNQIEIKPTVNAYDVGQNIARALERTWFYDPNSIQVSAQGGKIKLTGRVTTWNARDLAGATAWSAPGATFVENDIVVT